MYAEIINRLTQECRDAARAGATREQIQDSIITPAARSALGDIDARDFLEWIKDDRELSFYYYDAQHEGVCAKPVEAAAMMLERIALDSID
ncbi:MAG TPA: hypothetical protein VFQ92_15335 [Blastocatellia bacterium]|nr:hypothetical protein [Blastocatellia bacterium]